MDYKQIIKNMIYNYGVQNPAMYRQGWGPVAESGVNYGTLGQVVQNLYGQNALSDLLNRRYLENQNRNLQNNPLTYLPID